MKTSPETEKAATELKEELFELRRNDKKTNFPQWVALACLAILSLTNIWQASRWKAEIERSQEQFYAVADNGDECLKIVDKLVEYRKECHRLIVKSAGQTRKCLEINKKIDTANRLK